MTLRMKIAVDLSKVLPNVKTVGAVGRRVVPLAKAERAIHVRPKIENPPVCQYCSMKATHVCDSCHAPLCAKHVTREEPYDCCPEHKQQVVPL